MQKATSTLILFFTLFSLNLLAQTTQDEFNYITKGYKVQLESGLDMKKGYVLKDIKEINDDYITSNGFLNTSFKALYKEGQTKPVALMVVYKKKMLNIENVYYLCIPSYSSSKDIWEQSYKLFDNNFEGNSTMNWATIKTLINFISYQATK